MIEIVPYRNSWVEEFESLAAAIKKQLNDLIIRVDHIGSTSVFGLAAKDCIDIQITVLSFDSYVDLEQGLSAVGVVSVPQINNDHIPPGWEGDTAEWEKRFFRSLPDKRRVNVHVRKQGNANQRYALLFRDYLRANEKAALAYAELKRQLAKRHGDDINAYCDIKDPACDLIMQAAEDWAIKTKW